MVYKLTTKEAYENYIGYWNGKLKEQETSLSGEWYANLLSTGTRGKQVIHFFHSPTKLSILCPGRSLNKVLPEFPGRVEQLLHRLRYSKLVFQFQLHTNPEIYTTNSRSMLPLFPVRQ